METAFFGRLSELSRFFSLFRRTMSSNSLLDDIRRSFEERQKGVKTFGTQRTVGFVTKSSIVCLSAVSRLLIISFMV
jgi:hypothetical protein